MMNSENSLLVWAKRIILVIQCLYSGALLSFSIAVLMTIDRNHIPISGPGGIVLFWILIIWLAYLEGGQNALVGLQPVDKSTYKNKYSITYMSTSIAHKEGNIDRFIIGRQLLVVIVVFAINLSGTIKEGCSKSFYLTNWLATMACDSGIAMIIITLLLGQLTSQILSAKYMIEFINNYIMVIATYFSLAIEFSGILHSVYLVQIIFTKLTESRRGGDVKKSNLDSEKSILHKIFFWVRVFMSLLFLTFAFAVHLSEISKGRTTMYKGSPPGLSIAIFFLLMIIVGHLEGMQIALFSVMKADQNVPRTALAKAACDYAFTDNRIAKLVVGRQILATVCMFIIARITSINANHKDFKDYDKTTFGVSKGFQAFLNTNLLAALITTIVASLSFRVIASQFPMMFLSNPLIWVILRICSLLEATGIMKFAWVLAEIIHRVRFYKTDDEITTRPDVARQPSTVVVEVGEDKQQNGRKHVTPKHDDMDEHAL